MKQQGGIDNITGLSGITIPKSLHWYRDIGNRNLTAYLTANTGGARQELSYVNLSANETKLIEKWSKLAPADLKKLIDKEISRFPDPRVYDYVDYMATAICEDGNSMEIAIFYFELTHGQIPIPAE